MTTEGGGALIAVLNTSEEITAVIEDTLEMEGYRTISAFTFEAKRGDFDLEAFLAEHDPAAVVYDIAIPYVENFEFFLKIRNSPVGRARGFVVTTTNKRALEEMVGPVEAIEIIGKPYDLQMLLDAVGRAMKSRSAKPA